MKYSIIISYKEGSEDRKINLKRVLKYLSQLLNDDCEIVLVEQDNVSKINWLFEIKNNKFINHIFVHNSGIFNKGWGYNIGVKESKFDNLIFHDADMFLKIEKIKYSVELLDKYEVINPYDSIHYLNKLGSELFISNNYNLNVIIDQYQNVIPKVITGGIFMIKKENFLVIKGYDENFYGWGYEDTVLDLKITKLNLSIKTLDNIALHYYHPGVNDYNDNKINDEYFSLQNINKLLLIEYQKMNNNELRNKIENIQSFGNKDIKIKKITDIIMANNIKKIPKIIHQIWLGDQSKRPKYTMDKWKKMNPEWEYWLWTEDAIKRIFGKLQNQKQFDKLINLYDTMETIKSDVVLPDDYLSAQSNILKYEILYTFGGIYVDAFSIPLKPLDVDICNNESLFIYNNKSENDLISNKFLGSYKLNPLMNNFIKEIKKIDNILCDEPWKLLGTLFLTKLIKNNEKYDIKIYLDNSLDTNSMYYKQIEKNYSLLQEIPKRIFFYWSGNNMSWMRYMTLYTCRKFNPDWEIVLYLSNNNNTIRTWNNPEEQDFFNYQGINYLDKVKELNIKIEKIEWGGHLKEKFINIPPVHESDLFRYYQLYKNGGIYCDMDILFFRPMDNFYNEINNKYDTILYQCAEYIAIGLLASSKNNEFYKELFDYALDNLNVSEYQSLGVNLIYKKYKNENQYIIDRIKLNHPSLKIHSIPTSLIYHYDFYKIQHNYINPMGINYFDTESIGYHWYGGDVISQHYNNILTENNYMYHNTTFSEIVKNIEKVSIYKNEQEKKINRFIVVVPVYNAEKYIQKCIDSILDQDYDNFNFVVIDDCSTDNTYEILKKLNQEYIFDLIRNDKRNGSPLENIIQGINYLSTDKEDIIVTVDGDDWLYDNEVLSYLNDIYQDENIWMTYGQFEPLSKIQNNDTTYVNYCGEITNTRTYRKSELWLASHLRTVKRKLWDKIDDKDLRDEKNNYYKTAGDCAILYPIIEMSGHKHMKFINKFLYVYNNLNPINEMKIYKKEQLDIANIIKNKKSYKELDKL